VRNTNRNVELVQQNVRDDRKLVYDLDDRVKDIGHQLTELTSIVEAIRSELSNLIDCVGAGPARMEHDLSFDVSAIPHADSTTVRPTSLRTLIEHINMTTDQIFSRLTAWNDNVFNPINAFGINAVLNICWDKRMTDGRRFLAATGSSSHSFISTSYRPLLSKYTPL
jgi:hypothetical protein